MERKLISMVLLFYAISFLGWCIEVALKYRQFHRFINRGFLTGPCLPIYGSGAVLITIATSLVAHAESAYGTTFLISVFLCGVLEYLVSLFLEKRYHARWWDYSRKPMNLNGRVWIGNLMLFGLGGVAVTHWVDPAFSRLLSMAPLMAQRMAAIVLTAIFLADAALSSLVMRLLKRNIDKSEADNTEQISHEIRLLLKDRAFFYRRFADAYPDVIYRTDRIKARLERIRTETERLIKEAEAKLEAGRSEVRKSKGRRSEGRK